MLTIGALFILTLCLTSIFSWGVSSADDFYVMPVVKNPPAPVPGAGQMHCTTETGTSIDCSGTGQDYDYEAGIKWPDPRFGFKLGGYRDRLTGLIWQANADNGPMKWESALGFCNTHVIFDPDAGIFYDDWRLPTSGSCIAWWIMAEDCRLCPTCTRLPYTMQPTGGLQPPPGIRNLPGWSTSETEKPSTPLRTTLTRCMPGVCGGGYNNAAFSSRIFAEFRLSFSIIQKQKG